MVKEQMKEIKDEVVACQLCPLHLGRNIPVVGMGDHGASIMFIGEAPGESEDKTGMPFVGQAGKQLDKELNRIGLKREDVYITNTVKCRPPENRPPTSEEKCACSYYLTSQIEIINPKIIVALGYHAASYVYSLFGHSPSTKMGDLINKVESPTKEWIDNYNANGGVISNDIKFIAILHPASVLYSPSNMPKFKEGFNMLKQYIDAKK